MSGLSAALLFVLLLALPSPARAQTESVPPAQGSGSAASPPAAPAPVAPAPDAPVPVAPAPSAPATAPAAPREWLKAVYEQVADSVVLIETEYGTGSGFFFHDSRLVATALHVVDDADTIVVGASDGRRQLGHVVAYSRKHDVALVELEQAMPSARVLEPWAGIVAPMPAVTAEH